MSGLLAGQSVAAVKAPGADDFQPIKLVQVAGEGAVGRGQAHDAQRGRLEEIKTIRGHPDEIPENRRQLHWAQLFDPAIKIATDGFRISPRMSASIAASATQLQRDPEARAYFLNADGTTTSINNFLGDAALLSGILGFLGQTAAAERRGGRPAGIHVRDERRSRFDPHAEGGRIGGRRDQGAVFCIAFG